MEEHNVLPKTLVISAGESMIFQMGHENGMNFCRNVMSEIEDDEESLDALFNLVLEKAGQFGWAIWLSNSLISNQEPLRSS